MIKTGDNLLTMLSVLNHLSPPLNCVFADLGSPSSPTVKDSMVLPPFFLRWSRSLDIGGQLSSRLTQPKTLLSSNFCLTVQAILQKSVGSLRMSEVSDLVVIIALKR